MIYPTMNVELLKAALARIKADPTRWNQSAYRTECGTTMCVAGHALTIAGSTWKYDEETPMYWIPSLPQALKHGPLLGEGINDAADIYPYGYWSVAGMAQALLGLTEQEASELFFSLWKNDVSELEVLVDKIINGHYRGPAAEVSL